MKTGARIFYPFSPENAFGVATYNLRGLRIYNLLKVFSGYFGSLLKELKYAWKTFKTIRHKFVALEARRNDEWGDADKYDNPYYVCAKFGNGRHIPLPIIWHVSGLQGSAVRIACCVSRQARTNLMDAQSSIASIYEPEDLEVCWHP